jgi:hypothetical protein
MEWRHANSPSKESWRRSHQWVNRSPLSFGKGKRWSFWISWNPDKPSNLTTTSRRWISWRPEFSESGQRSKQPFYCNTITLGPIPVWRPWGKLQSFAGLSYHTHRIRLD